MTPKERVHNALSRKPVDRTPMWMWYHPAMYDRMCKRFGWNPDDVDSALGNDIKSVHININREMFRPLQPGERFTDEWGVTWTKEGWYNQECGYPLAGLPSSALREYRFPDPDAEDRYLPLSRLCESAPDHFIGVDISPAIFEVCWHVRGMDWLMMDMVQDRASVEAFFDNAAEFTRRACLRALKYPIDWIWLGDDVAGQEAMMMSPHLWRSLLKPRLASIIAAVKEARPGIWVPYHCCGAMRPIIPDLIEIGVDVLNPIQSVCPGMDPIGLKKDFGEKLAFMGGIDTQDFLIHATPEEVLSHSRYLIDAMGAGGGYIFAASHTIQPDTPLENILALTEAATGIQAALVR